MIFLPLSRNSFPFHQTTNPFFQTSIYSVFPLPLPSICPHRCHCTTLTLFVGNDMTRHLRRENCPLFLSTASPTANIVRSVSNRSATPEGLQAIDSPSPFALFATGCAADVVGPLHTTALCSRLMFEFSVYRFASHCLILFLL